MANIQPDNSGRVRAIILTTQRTGSTFLTDCLRSHPDIECAGEILNGDPDEPRPSYRGPFKDLIKSYRYARSGAWLADRWIRNFYARGSAQVRCFKAMYNQLSRPLAMRYFRENPEVRVIHLRRENLLKVHVSTLLMSKRRNVQTRSPADPVWTHVDPGQAIASMREARSVHAKFERAFARHPRLQLAYEDLIDGQNIQEESARAICAFLGVRDRPMGSDLLKLNPESLRDMVTNYDELASAILKSEFADMLA